jgi:hypothetical protein
MQTSTDPLRASDGKARDAGRHVVARLRAATRIDEPYTHWLPEEMLPPDLAEATAALPLEPPSIADTLGRRETNNQSRTYFNADIRTRFAVCDTVAAAFQDPETVAGIGRTCGVDLTGTSLRIEYCLDTDGFWLEPHTDIGVKKLTMLIYLSKGPGADTLGTDIFDSEGRIVKTSPSPFNGGLVFVPSDRTWHGFRRRPIQGVRKSVIVNYVGPEWRARHELSYPDRPVG